MFIELEPINQSKLCRSGMVPSSLFVPLPWSWAGMGDGFCYRHVAPDGALEPPRRLDDENRA